MVGLLSTGPTPSSLTFLHGHVVFKKNLNFAVMKMYCCFFYTPYLKPHGMLVSQVSIEAVLLKLLCLKMALFGSIWNIPQLWWVRLLHQGVAWPRVQGVVEEEGCREKGAGSG